MTTPLQRTENDAIIEALADGHEPDILAPGHAYAFKLRDRVEVVDLTDKHLAQPRRKTGTVNVVDAASFAIYHRKHADSGTEVYADINKDSITAVLNAHQATEGVIFRDETARWGDHRLILTLNRTPGWDQWIALNGKDLDQVGFAEFLEDHLPDIVAPSGADMLEMAMKFQATSEASFSSAIVLQNGDRQLTYTDVTNARAGGGGQVEIPKSFTIRLRSYEDALPIDITARFRYRVRGGRLTLGYLLDKPEERLKEAFRQVVATVAADLEIPILQGVPTAATAPPSGGITTR